MSEQFQMQISDLGPHWQPSKLNIIHTDTHVPVGADHIQFVIQGDVDLNRVVEIFETAKFLVDHMRDANMMSSAGGSIYAMVGIEARKAGVRQATDILGVEATDIVIGVGDNINVASHNFSQALDSGFRMLREYAKDEFLKQR